MATTDNFYREYFGALLRMMRGIGIQVGSTTPYAGQFQIVYRLPNQQHIAVNVLTRDQEIRVDLTLKSKEAHKQYLLLKEQQHVIEEIVGKELEWNSQPKVERQIIWRLKKTDPTKRSDWPRQHAWLAARLVAFRVAFGATTEVLDA